MSSPRSEAVSTPGPQSLNPFDRGPLQSWTVLQEPLNDVPRAVAEASQQASETFPSSVIELDGSHYISFKDLARFRISFDARTVTAFDIAVDTDQATHAHLLYDHVAPRILAHEGHFVLHGSAVAIDGEVAIFLGETGTGKSTLAASLHKAGHTLLGDDAVIVSANSNTYVAEAVYPSMRLFPDTISALVDDTIEVSAMAHYSQKQRVLLPDVSGPPRPPLPVSALFILSGETDIGTPCAHRIGPSQACIWALEQAFSLDSADPGRAASRMAAAARLIEGVGAYSLNLPYEYDRLAEVHALIQACMDGRKPDANGAD